jgi:hypothetical protein
MNNLTELKNAAGFAAGVAWDAWAAADAVYCNAVIPSNAKAAAEAAWANYAAAVEVVVAEWGVSNAAAAVARKQK